MLWFILSFLTALAVASHDAWVKKFFSDLSTYEMLAYPMIYSLPLLILTLPFVPVPPLDGIFISAFFIIRGNSVSGNKKCKATLQVSGSGLLASSQEREARGPNDKRLNTKPLNPEPLNR